MFGVIDWVKNKIAEALINYSAKQAVKEYSEGAAKHGLTLVGFKDVKNGSSVPVWRYDHRHKDNNKYSPQGDKQLYKQKRAA